MTAAPPSAMLIGQKMAARAGLAAVRDGPIGLGCGRTSAGKKGLLASFVGDIAVEVALAVMEKRLQVLPSSS